jgi:hypothetical protein
VLTDARVGVASLTPSLIVLGVDSIVPSVAHLAASPPLSPIVTDNDPAHVVVGEPNLQPVFLPGLTEYTHVLPRGSSKVAQFGDPTPADCPSLATVNTKAPDACSTVVRAHADRVCSLCSVTLCPDRCLRTCVAAINRMCALLWAVSQLGGGA